MTSVSVVVPTYNRCSRLAMVLQALADQTLSVEDFEVVVVSDGSTDGTDEYLRDGRAPLSVTFVSQPNQGVAVARNAGVEASCGELIVFIDDDVVPEPEWLAAHIAAHGGSSAIRVVIGPLLTPETIRLEPWAKWEQTMLYKQYDAMIRGDWAPTARQFYTGNASLSRECFLSVGGFDRSFRRAEDVEFAYRLDRTGVEFEFHPEARAFHHVTRSYDSWLANATAYGTNDVVFWREGGQEWLLPRIRAEYRRRHPLTRSFSRFGLAVPVAGRVVSRFAPKWAEFVDRLGLEGGGRRVLSAVYNLAYLQGLVDELGGLERFLAIEAEY